LVEVSEGKYRYNDRGVFVEGIIKRSRNGKNYLLPDDGGTPIFIAERNSKHALDGDRVRAIHSARKVYSEPEGEVVAIIERAQTNFVGILVVEKNFAFLSTDSKKLANDILIPKDKLKGGKTGQKAVVRITEWPEHSKNPFGEVIDILGDAGDNDTEMNAIMAEFGLPYKYPEAVEQQAELLTEVLPEEEISRRVDFREVTTFTIDPFYAKDFDDALSIRQLKENEWEVGVHIADVTHYVLPDTLIDREAQKRATSIYLVDRTVPMLPERLSNYLCSLRPNEDKCCFSCVFVMDEQAHVKKFNVVKTLIRSNRRFTYEEVQAIIEGAPGDFADELRLLNAMAQKMRQRRFAAGAINFERSEMKFRIDEKGKPIEVMIKTAKESNQLIEEFMLLANRTVATFIGQSKPKKTFVYRVHDLPDGDKMENLSQFIKRFGYKIKTTGGRSDISKSINQLLDKVQGRKEENLIETVAIRAMSKAVYSTNNIGHYGLAFDYYTHFTSPIRRYPDMMVHRLLERYLQGGRSASAEKYEALCRHSSDMEQLAQQAERASIKYKMVEYMAERIGQVYDGIISGWTEWGLYVELKKINVKG
jgi:ribonuclease R